jgi:hypothetical protein
MTIQPVGTRTGVTLRHWTIGTLSLVGAQPQPAPARARREGTEGRRVGLVAARLGLVKEAFARNR